MPGNMVQRIMRNFSRTSLTLVGDGGSKETISHHWEFCQEVLEDFSQVWNTRSKDSG